jgi:surface carbohydrate biosynthesis protein
MKKICLIVDNPLRDLDGLVLLARELALCGFEAWLIPMYEQPFDIRAIGADFVLLNYVRENNIYHAYAYQEEGVRVGVLDTEGVGGKSAKEFAELVSKSGGARAMDLYCVWGEAQKNALNASDIISPKRIYVTGCPRYDYCAKPWLYALSKPPIESGYILINTNFSLVNPEFSAGREQELDAAISAGFTREFAQSYIEDASKALGEIIDLIEYLLLSLPDQKFVLRPHPFESKVRYQHLAKYSNFSLYQQGTSIEWLSSAKALIHLNCSTAIESAILGKNAFTPIWLDSKFLNVPGPSKVSIKAKTPNELVNMLSRIDNSQFKEDNAEAIREFVYPLYYKIDGKASERVVEAIEATFKEKNNIVKRKLSMKFIILNFLRNALGYRKFEILSRLLGLSVRLQYRKNKLFTLEKVMEIVKALDKSDPRDLKVEVVPMKSSQLNRPHLASMLSVKIVASKH